MRSCPICWDNQRSEADKRVLDAMSAISTRELREGVHAPDTVYRAELARRGVDVPPEPYHDPNCRVCAGQQVLRDAGKAWLARRGDKP